MVTGDLKIMCVTPENVCLDDTVRIAVTPFNCMITFDHQPSEAEVKIHKTFNLFGAFNFHPRPRNVPLRAVAVQWQGLWAWGWNKGEL